MPVSVGVCTSCGPVENYYAKGMCSRCYAKDRRKKNPEYYSAKERDPLRMQQKRARDRKRYQARKAAGHFKASYARNIDKRRKSDKERWQTEHRKRWLREWKQKNIEKVREGYRQKYYKNKDKHIARVMERRKHRGIQTPAWLSEAHRKEMELFYKNRPLGYHVDHIVPLQGKEVKGLHVPWNLQYLPATENLKKGNR